MTPRQKSWSVCVLYTHCTTTQDSHYRSLRSSLSSQSCNNIEVCGNSPSYELEPWQKASNYHNCAHWLNVLYYMVGAISCNPVLSVLD